MALTPGEFAERLEKRPFKSHLERLMSRAVLTVEGNAKREAPVKTGHLRRSITSRVEQGGERGVVGTNVSYARAVHEGTRPHVIKAKNGKALKFTSGGQTIFRRQVNHPGTRANPFMERALRNSRDAIEAIMAESGEQWFMEIVK